MDDPGGAQITSGPSITVPICGTMSCITNIMSTIMHRRQFSTHDLPGAMRGSSVLKQRLRLLFDSISSSSALLMLLLVTFRSPEFASRQRKCHLEVIYTQDVLTGVRQKQVPSHLSPPSPTLSHDDGEMLHCFPTPVETSKQFTCSGVQVTLTVNHPV